MRLKTYHAWLDHCDLILKCRVSSRLLGVGCLISGLSGVVRASLAMSVFVASTSPWCEMITVVSVLTVSVPLY